MREIDHSMDGIDPDGPQSRPNRRLGRQILDDFELLQSMTESDLHHYCGGVA